MFKIPSVLIIFLLFTGCGSSHKKNAQNSNNKNETVLNHNAKSYFGILANATVNIYELSEGSKQLIFTERTTSGETLKKIGNFDSHIQDFDQNKYYQYEVFDGENWDIDHNGIKDNTATKNHYLYRTIYKGYKRHIAWWGTKKHNSNRVSEK